MSQAGLGFPEVSGVRVRTGETLAWLRVPRLLIWGGSLGSLFGKGVPSWLGSWPASV